MQNPARARSVAVALLTLGLLSCRGESLEPRWLDREILVDGDPGEWDELLVEVEDEDLDFGYANDDGELVLCLTTSDRGLRRQALMGGLEIWLDPSGGEKEIFGLRYPVGLAGELGSPTSRPDVDRGELQEEMLEEAAAHLDRVELLRAAGHQPGPRRLSELEGVEIASLLTSQSLMIEMRIPLRGDDGLSLELAGGATTIGVGLRTVEVDGPRRRPNRMSRPGGPGGSGPGGIGGGRPGGMGGGMGGGPGGIRGGRGGPGARPSPPEPLDLWISLPLASRPSR